MRHTVAAAASRRFFSGASFRPSTGHWGSALENFLRADGQGDRRQNDNRKAPIEAPDDSVWVQCQRWCDSETIHSALTNAVCADVTTSSPAMRLVLRKFTDHGGSEVADDTLRKLAESLFLQWKHGFPRTPYGLDQLTHGFYRYPAGMQPASAGLLISGAVLQFIQSGNDTGPSTIKVFDPCCGSGTTLVEVQRAQKSKQLIAGVVDPAMFSKSQAYSDASSSPGTEQTSEDGPHPIRFDPLPTGSTLRSFGNDVSPLAVFVATGQTWQPEASELAAFRALATDIAKIARSKVRLQEAPASQGGGARIEGAFESLRILIDEVGQQIDGCSGAESEALPQESLTNSPDMKGPLSFCFLVATQRGMPLVEAERQAAAKAELKFAPSRKQAKKMKAQLRMNQRRRRKRDGKGAWQKQWGVHNKSGSNNDALHAEDAVDLFESVVAEYCRRLGMLQPFDDNVPGSTESQFTDDVCIAPPVISQASVLEGVETERTNVSGSDLFQCIVTSPPYPAIYDYLSFARHARADFDPESAPDGRDWSEHWSSSSEMGAHKRFKRLQRDWRKRTAEPAAPEDAVFQVEWLKEHNALLHTLGRRLAPGGVAAVMIGDGGVKDNDLVRIDTLATTLALATVNKIESGDAVGPLTSHGLKLIASASAESVVTQGRMNKRTEHILLLQKCLHQAS